MKVIIAGGRDYRFSCYDLDILNGLSNKLPITEVVCGLATGADTAGKLWAERRGIRVEDFPALWDDLSVIPCLPRKTAGGKEYNALAGTNRNLQMAKYADAVVLFEGGTGTTDMYKKALKHKLKIIDLR